MENAASGPQEAPVGVTRTAAAQLESALAYCRNKSCGARKALTENPGRWPDVTRSTLHAKLSQKSKQTAKEHKDAILTRQERKDLAETMRRAADGGCAMRKVDRDYAVLDILRWRKSQNAVGGRGFSVLSGPAKSTLKNGKASKVFWRKFFKDFTDLHPNHKVVTTSMQRAKQCTREVAAEHLDKLRKTAAKLGIYDLEADRFVPGKQGNIIWLDEMNQFFNYLLAPGNNLYRTARRGQRARQASSENRGTFTGSAACGFDGQLYDPQMIFKQDSLSASMAPECVRKLRYMLISNTENGVQTGQTFLDWLKEIEKQARANGVTGPILYCTDGHASRFWIKVLQWLRDNHHDMFLTPPNATGSCCMLDQIFQDLHSSYDNCVMDMKFDHSSDIKIGIVESVQIFVQCWMKPWCSWKQRERGFRVIGLAENKINIDFMPPSQFTLGAAIVAAEAEEPLLAIEGAPAENEETEPTPEKSIRRSSKEYLEKKVELLREQVTEVKKRKTSPLEQGVLRATWFKKPEKKKRHMRITAVWGSMNATELLERRLQMEAAEMDKQKKKADELALKNTLFENCIGGCQCDAEKCAAAGMMKCAVCNEIKRSCSKKVCKEEKAANPQLVDMKIPKNAAIATAVIAEGVDVDDGIDDWEEDEEDDEELEDEEDSGAEESDEYLNGFKVGDPVRVYWSMREPPDWFHGVVTKIGHVKLKIKYTDGYQHHDPNRWDIEKLQKGPDSDDSDNDDLPLALIV